MGREPGRVRETRHDWEMFGLYRGQRVPVLREESLETWLFVAEVVELPPWAWVVLANGGGRRGVDRGGGCG